MGHKPRARPGGALRQAGPAGPAAGLSLLHQAFFLGDARCAFFGEESVASVARLLGLPFLQSETDRLLARLRAVRTRLLRRAREAGAQGLFDAGDYAQRAADFAEALEDPGGGPGGGGPGGRGRCLLQPRERAVPAGAGLGGGGAAMRGGEGGAG